MKASDLDTLKSDLERGYYGSPAAHNLATLLQERAQLLGALRALMVAVSDDCIECAKAREALAAAES